MTNETITEERVRKMLGATAFVDPPDAAKDMKELCRAYLTLQRQVQEMREVQDGLLKEVDVVMELGLAPENRFDQWWDGCVSMGKRVRTALAALEARES